jgi:hypothetical protein
MCFLELCCAWNVRGNLLVKFGTEMTVLEHYNMIEDVSISWGKYRSEHNITARNVKGTDSKDLRCYEQGHQITQCV